MKRLLEEDRGDPISFDYGELRVHRVTESVDFLGYLDELRDEYNEDNHQGLYRDRDRILDAFVEKRLYVLRMEESDSMYKNKAQRDRLFVRHGWYRLPCLCITTMERRDTVTMLWTAKRARCRGFATALLDALGIRYVVNIVNDTEDFWVARGITEINDVKPSFATITGHYNTRDTDDCSLSAIDEMCDSSEDEDEVNWIPLSDQILYKQWLVGVATGVCDIGYVIGLYMRLIHHNDIMFIPIDPSYWTHNYGIMSDERVYTQKFKAAQLRHYVRIDHALYYGQCVRDVDSVVRNKTMIVSRPYHNNNRSVTQLTEILGEYNLRVHMEQIKFRNNPGAWLIVIVDTGINMEKAIEFARSIDAEND